MKDIFFLFLFLSLRLCLCVCLCECFLIITVRNIFNGLNVFIYTVQLVCLCSIGLAWFNGFSFCWSLAPIRCSGVGCISILVLTLFKCFYMV